MVPWAVRRACRSDLTTARRATARGPVPGAARTGAGRDSRTGSAAGQPGRAHATADRIASDIWKALKRCPVAKLASMPARNANAGASRDGCTAPIHISGV